jgi:hypothetical protein
MTKAQREMLQDAERMPRLGFDGVIGKGPRRRTALALVKAGFLRDAGLGVESDGDGYATVPERWATIYEITDAGRAALSQRDGGGNDERSE